MDDAWGDEKFLYNFNHTRFVPKVYWFSMYDLGIQNLVDVYRRVDNDLGCMYILVETGSVVSVMSYWCLRTAVLYNLCNVYDATSILFTKNLSSRRESSSRFYRDVLERLRKRVQRVRKNIAGDWVLHHDNAPAHTALSIREFLVKKNIPTLSHPP
jgi:hypothetical protein